MTHHRRLRPGRGLRSAFLCSYLSAVGCGDGVTRIDLALDLGHAEVALTGDGDPASDVVSARVTFSVCGASGAIASVTTPLFDAIPAIFLPGDLRPASGAEHVFLDTLQVLPTGCYSVLVEPLTATGDRSVLCSPTTTELQVVEGGTLEVSLLVSCLGDGRGTITLTGHVNHPPVIDSVRFGTSRFFCAPQERVCLKAHDPDHDPLDFELTTAANFCTVSAATSTSAEEQCFDLSCSQPGRVELTASVFDKFEAGGRLIRVEDQLESTGIDALSHSEVNIPAFSIGSSTWPDADGDGFGDANATPALRCEANPPQGGVSQAGDCNDANAEVSPNDPEVCGNGLDDNCDGTVDEGCVCNAQAPLDVVLFQDTSGSFTTRLPRVQAAAPALFDALAATGRDARLGLASFVDKPVFPFGADGDYVFRIEPGGELTRDRTQFLGAVERLETRNGRDLPESQIEGLMHIGTHSLELGYRPEARKLVVLVTDAAFHEAGECLFAGACTEPNNGDSIIDLAEDYPEVELIALSLALADVTPVFAVTPGNESTYEELLDRLEALGVSRGFVVTLPEDQAGVTEALLTVTEPEQPRLFFPDLDGDGFGDAGSVGTLTCNRPPRSSPSADDCDDQNANVHPAAAEVCGNGRDENCDAVDPVCAAAAGSDRLGR